MYLWAEFIKIRKAAAVACASLISTKKPIS
jgi:hypothetical protein